MARKSVEKNISYDDGKKLYYVNFDYGKDENGKRIKKAKTYSKISEARAALKEFEADKTKGALVIPKDITLQEWLAYWINDIVVPNREKSTVYGYQNIINKHINPELGSTSLQKLNAQQIQRYFTMLLTEKKLSSNTVRKHHDLLKTALKVAVKQDVILRNPIEKVEPPRLQSKEINYYTPDDLRRLLELVKGNRIEVVVYLAGYLGLRREEICGLSWDDVDFENKDIFIRRARTTAGGNIIEKSPKNKSSTRKLHLADDLLTVLKNEKRKQESLKSALKMEYSDNGLIVVWENGKPYRPNYVSDMFTKFISDNNMPKIKLHGLRHTFASIANLMGVSLYDIGKALGHSTPITTGKIYTHLFDDTQENTMKKVAESMAQKKD